MDPLFHYIRHGWREGRDPNGWFSTRGYLQAHASLRGGDEDPLTHLTRNVLGVPSSDDGGAGALYEAAEPHDGELLSSLAAFQPGFATKWLRPNYLAKGLSELDRARIFLNTYEVLSRAFPLAGLKRLLLQGRQVWRSGRDGETLAISLILSRPFVNEGELSLVLSLDGEALYVMSISLVPASSQGEQSLLVSRMQSAPCDRDVGKRAIKAMDGVSPQVATFAALQGFAQALGIGRFIGVPAERQVSIRHDAIAKHRKVYDDFFEERGGERLADGFFHGPIVKRERPLAEIKPGHKIRTRVKRAFRQTIASEVARSLSLLAAER